MGIFFILEVGFSRIWLDLVGLAGLGGWTGRGGETADDRRPAAGTATPWEHGTGKADDRRQSLRYIRAEFRWHNVFHNGH